MGSLWRMLLHCLRLLDIHPNLVTDDVSVSRALSHEFTPPSLQATGTAFAVALGVKHQGRPPFISNMQCLVLLRLHTTTRASLNPLLLLHQSLRQRFATKS